MVVVTTGTGSGCFSGTGSAWATGFSATGGAEAQERQSDRAQKARRKRLGREGFKRDMAYLRKELLSKV
jgi:hypothetical protein